MFSRPKPDVTNEQLVARIVSLHGTVLDLKLQVDTLRQIVVRSETRLCKLMIREGVNPGYEPNKEQ